MLTSVRQTSLIANTMARVRTYLAASTAHALRATLVNYVNLVMDDKIDTIVDF